MKDLLAVILKLFVTLGNRGENIASIPAQLLEGAIVLVQSLGQRWGENSSFTVGN